MPPFVKAALTALVATATPGLMQTAAARSDAGGAGLIAYPGVPQLVAPGTHYWWLSQPRGNVAGADPSLCSGEGPGASPEALCGASGTYLGRCGSGAGFGVRGILMPRRTPAEMQIVLAERAGRRAWLACAPVADRAAAQALARQVAGRRPPADAPGLAAARRACAKESPRGCNVAWYGFEPLGGPARVAADLGRDGKASRTATFDDAEAARQDAAAAAKAAEMLRRRSPG